ncbi:MULTISPECIES: acylphosphatase [Staphylococcus]|uniref:acylphosphatase n=1 Tax=Staphylococcus chromogenes TaxID=46126 RepID=A0AAE5SXJ0_STACR|nr:MULTISPECIES: acylphosphatase [Staphylococcus]KDP13372.1 acylphosphatase [Staphylococcus chromogenes MU 970]MBP0045893.1 acylphosphatase [Staphylococcus chromogenes]MBV5136930.1 acylphosphatase [Staphylococcus chromogenes]MBV5190383.1 acylphosphatase [Staphylococcus chromogenes]MBW3132813.1 acylphosphatase [Staphylococcus chromogenes]
MKHQFIKVYGRVQGVGFRYFTQKLAQKYNITGYVKNVQDHVEIDAQGEIEDLSSFTQEVTHGASPASEVNDYTIEEREINKHLTTFKTE